MDLEGPEDTVVVDGRGAPGVYALTCIYAMETKAVLKFKI